MLGARTESVSTQGEISMSEPFDVDVDPTGSDSNWTNSSKPDLQEKASKIWKSVWKQNLSVKRKGEAAMQLPLALAIGLGLIFPHMAAVVLLLGLAFGYSFTVDGR
jgi:hypothetical protein